MKIKQKGVYLAKLYPSNSKLKKIRPCIVVQNNFLNKVLDTVVIIPLSSQKSREESIYEIRVNWSFLDKPSTVLIHQIQSIDKKRFLKKLGEIDQSFLAKTTTAINLLM